MAGLQVPSTVMPVASGQSLKSGSACPAQGVGRGRCRRCLRWFTCVRSPTKEHGDRNARVFGEMCRPCGATGRETAQA
eukprot:4303672-Lingulodinium_polyedra.AAC.1